MKSSEVERWDDGLTQKQRVWVLEYVRCFNATEAARRARYKGNDNTLSTIASENMRKPALRSAINRLMEDASMAAAEVTARLTAQARGEAPTRRLERDGEEVQVYESHKALRDLARIRGLYDEKRGTTTRVGILVLPALAPPGALTARQQQALDMEEQEDGSYAVVNGKPPKRKKGVLVTGNGKKP